MLQTNYYDLCGTGDAYPNLPARAWAWSVYLQDFAVHGSTPFNSNYVDRRWALIGRWSSLVEDRGFFHIIPALRQKVGLGADAAAHRRAEVHMEDWLKMIAANDMASPECKTREQDEALDRILEFAKTRKLDISIIVWPVIPKAQTEATLAVTDRFKTFLANKAAPRGIPIHDLQAENVVVDADFRPDLDHLLASGDQKILAWGLSGPFRDLPAQLAAAHQRSPEDAR